MSVALYGMLRHMQPGIPGLDSRRGFSNSVKYCYVSRTITTIHVSHVMARPGSKETLMS